MSALRLLLADGQNIPYTLKVSVRRRTVGLQVNEHGLTVHVPAGIPQHAVECLLREKGDWIARQLAKRCEQRPAPCAWRGGQLLHYHGLPVQLCLRQEASSRPAELDGSRLYLALADPEDAPSVRREVIQWLVRQASTDFARRLELLAIRLGVPVPPFKLSSARTRWGSCNAKGEIRLNWRLIQAPPHIIHYVIAHELAHLKEMNHSQHFWAWVEKLCPDYKTARQDLKALSVQLHWISR